MDLLLTNMQLFTSQDMLLDWGHVGYLWIIVMFLSAVWTLILMAPIHCKGASNAKFLQICTDEETNSSTSWMAWGLSTFSFLGELLF